MAIYFFTTKKRGISSYQLAKWLDIKQTTAWFVMHRLREALKDENQIILNGIVEADETFIGPNVNRDTRLQREMKKHYDEQDAIHGMSEAKRARHNRKHGIVNKGGRPKGTTKSFLEKRKLERGKRIPYEKHSIILGITEQGGKMIMKKLGNNRASIHKDIIFPHLKNHISSDSIFVTDEASAYQEVKGLFAEHRTVNHQKGYVINKIHINNIENIWNHLKRTIEGTYFHFSDYHFNRYLDEHTYRWNRRKETEQSLFDSFFTLVSGKEVSYKRLTGKEYKMAA